MTLLSFSRYYEHQNFEVCFFKRSWNSFFYSFDYSRLIFRLEMYEKYDRTGLIHLILRLTFICSLVFCALNNLRLGSAFKSGYSNKDILGEDKRMNSYYSNFVAKKAISCCWHLFWHGPRYFTFPSATTVPYHWNSNRECFPQL